MDGIIIVNGARRIDLQNFTVVCIIMHIQDELQL